MAHRDVALGARLTKWEGGGDISLAELTLVAMVQIGHGWSDTDLLKAAGASPASDDRWTQLVGALEEIREELATLVYVPATVKRLRCSGFGTRLDVDAIERRREAGTSAAVRAQAADALSTTICGLYLGIRDWYQRVGEGRVGTIKSIIAAERAVRPVHGIIVFDEGTRMPRRNDIAVPGYRGVLGLFAEMLGDPDLQPIAVLSNEMYLPGGGESPLTLRISARIRQTIVLGELRDTLLGFISADTMLDSHNVEMIGSWLDELLTSYMTSSSPSGRGGGLASDVLAPLRRRVRSARLAAPGRSVADRLSTRHNYIRDWAATVRQYLAICQTFDAAQPAELEQVSGRRRPFFVVPMGRGDRQQLMYDLTARIVDDQTLGFNAVLVSTWARTGWNVITPNLLIDATATRDVIAWQQLRGRAMRAMRTWNNTCCQLILLLMSGPVATNPKVPHAGAETAWQQAPSPTDEDLHLDAGVMTLLAELASGSGAGADAASALLRTAESQPYRAKRVTRSSSTSCCPGTK